MAGSDLWGRSMLQGSFKARFFGFIRSFLPFLTFLGGRTGHCVEFPAKFLPIIASIVRIPLQTTCCMEVCSDVAVQSLWIAWNC